MTCVRIHFYHSINYGCKEYFPDPNGSTVIYASCYFPEIKYLRKILDAYLLTSYGLVIMNVFLVTVLLIIQDTCCKFEKKILSHEAANNSELNRMTIENGSRSSIMSRAEYKHVMDDEMHKKMAANVRLPFLETCFVSDQQDQEAELKKIEDSLKVEDADFKKHIDFFFEPNNYAGFQSRVIVQRTGAVTGQLLTFSELETHAKQISTSESSKSLTTASLWSRSQWSDSSRFVPQFSPSSTFSSMN